jgi:hypothetical protein
MSAESAAYWEYDRIASVRAQSRQRAASVAKNYAWMMSACTWDGSTWAKVTSVSPFGASPPGGM